MTGRLKVLHVIQNLNYGGMERVLSDIVMHVDRERFESHILCLQYLGRFSQGLESIATLHVAAPRRRGSMLYPRALAQQMREIAPDVLHSHSGVWFKASYAARLAGVPRVVHTEHGRSRPDPLRHRIVDAIGAHRSDVVVAVSAMLAQQLARDLLVPARKLAVISNAVDTVAYQPRADTGRLRHELGLPSDVPIIGSVGRLEPIKGYDIMIDAFAALRARGRDRGAVLVIGGEGSQRAALEQRARALGVHDGVRILGWRDDVLDMHSAFTIFTLSSRSEGTSISLLEAMSGGLAPVVTDVGGNAAVLGAALASQLAPTEQPEALARAWERLLNDASHLSAVRAQARRRVLDAYGLEAMVRAYERVYRGETNFPGAGADGASGVRGVPPSPRISAECPPVT